MSLGKFCTKPAQRPLLPKPFLPFCLRHPPWQNKEQDPDSCITFSCSSCCSHFPTQTSHPHPETATAALQARPRVASECLKTFSFLHFSPAGRKLAPPDLCLNLGASPGLTTRLLCAQRCSVRQPGSQINPHYGNRENYKGNDNCLERYVTMRLDWSGWPLVRFLLQVHLTVFCLL